MDNEITDIELYRKHVVYYFDMQLGNDILGLRTPDRYRMFQLLHDYADVLEQIFHPGIPIIEHILGKRWEAANANPHEGINWDENCEIINAYDKWLALSQ